MCCIIKTSPELATFENELLYVTNSKKKTKQNKGGIKE